jgi:YD repeat-containing protein
MMKSGFLLFVYFILFLISNRITAQVTEKYIDDIIPPSPEALSITKYGNTEVNLYNGIPYISIPIWNYRGKNFSFPVQLNYNAGGVKVNDIAPSVGLGWSLNAGGVISREVRSLPDDMATLGFLDSGALTYPDNATTQGKYIGYKYFMNEIDSQQDIFNVKLPAMSFIFVMNKNGDIYTDPVGNYKIEKVTGNLGIDAHGNITGWNITDENGIVYKFREKEFTQYFSSSDSHNAIENKPYVSSWYLSSIVAPFNNEVVDFFYSTLYSRYSLPESQSYNPDWIETERWVYITSKKLNTIKTANDTIQFNYDPDGYRQDLAGDKALTSISIKSGNHSKSFNLGYKYMNGSQFLNYSGCSSCTQGLGNNNLSYRLILKEVTEVGKNPYTFDYYSGLPSRDSYSIDHWGFFNGKNNSTLVPETFFYITFNGGYYHHYGEADRKVDSIYTQAGTLYKVTYPTGGTTEYEFENNKSCHPYLDYKIENKNYLLTGDYTTPPVEIEVSNYTSTYMTFSFELNVLPACFEDDFCIIYFHIRNQSTGEYEATVSFTKQEFDANDRLREIDLFLPNGTYDFTFSYDATPLCNLDDPFACSLSYTNELEDINKFAGGLRVKSVIDKLANGNIALQRTYNYLDENGISTGYILNYPVYLTLWDNYGNVCNNSGLYFGSLISNSRTLLGNTRGGPVGYSMVTEEYKNTETGSNGYSEYKYISPEHFPDAYAYSPNQEFPFPPPSSFENFRGRLTEKNVYNSSTQLARKVVNVYSNEYSWEDLYIPNLKVARDESIDVPGEMYYYSQSFSNYYTNGKLIRTSNSEYLNNEIITDTVKFYYENTYNKLKNKKQKNSIGEELTDSYYYTFDFASSGNIYQSLLDSNIISPVIKFEQTIDKNNDGIQDETTEGQKVNYDDFNSGKYYPAFIDKVEDGIYETKVVFDSYDLKGNLTQYHNHDNINTAIVWSYNSELPIVKAENVSYGTLLSAVNSAVYQAGYSDIDDLISDIGDLTTLSQKTKWNDFNNYLRSNPVLSDVLIKTFSYIPLFGMTSQTDPAGRTTYYEYDDFGRLELVRDQNNNIISKNEYHYAE